MNRSWPRRRARLAAGCATLIVLLGISSLAQAQTNPVPFVNQPPVPDAVAPGSSGFTLTVNGTGFVSGSLVQWNSVSLVTQFISGSQLMATVPTSDVVLTGTASVTVFSPKPAENVSNAQLFSVTTAKPSIALGAAPGQGPVGSTCTAVADFNGDGKPDVAIPNLSNAVAILLGNGDGTLQPPVTYSTGNFPYCVAAADLNHDEKVDLVVSNTGDNTVSVLFGNGDGTFRPHVDYAVGILGDTQHSVVVADLNADGNLDLAVANYFDGTISVLLGNRDGTFQPQQITQAYAAGSLAVGDFNGDGKLDLADAMAGVNIWLGNGDGTFTEGSYVNVLSPVDVAAADFNGDGKLDLAAINGGSGLYLALGSGDGTFQTPVAYSTSNSQSSLAAGDFNGDGRLDLALNGYALVPGTNNGPYVIVTLLGNGDGTFQAAVEEPSGSGVGALAAADFNNDGMMDFATIDGGVATVFLGTTAEFSPYIVNFGGQAAGTTSPPQTVTLTNAGSTAITISNVTINGDFAQTNNCGSSLAAGVSCAFNITFTPPTFGTDTGTMTVADTALGSPQTIALSGTGEGPGVSLSPSTVSFGNQPIGTSSRSQTVSLTNTGNQPLTISSIQGSLGFKKGTGCPPTLAAGASCTILVEFAPLHAGKVTGTLSVTDNAPGSPQTVTLTGTGVAFEISPAGLNFGSVSVGQTSPPQVVTVTNVAQTAQSINGIKITGHAGGVFAQTNNCGTSLPGLTSCTISVTFTPKTGGTATATLNINGGGAAQMVSLTGTGTR